jgi:hypothetical protein
MVSGSKLEFLVLFEWGGRVEREGTQAGGGVGLLLYCSLRR